MIKRKENLWKRLKKNSRFQKFLTFFLPVFLGVLLAASWQTQLLHRILGTDVFTLPLPSRIGTILAENGPKIIENVQATVFVALLGLICGSLIGYLIAILASVFSKWGSGGLSVVAAFNAIPIVALAPVMTNWTRGVSEDANVRSMVAKVIVVAIVCIANMSISAFRGLTDLKPFAADLMTSYAAGRFIIFRKLLLPNSVPHVFTALKVAVPASVIGALVSEYFAEYVIGVGRQIRENIVIAQYAVAWAYIAVACFIGIIMYVILIFSEGIILKHRGK